MDLLWVVIILQLFILVRTAEKPNKRGKSNLSVEIDLHTEKARKEMSKFCTWLDNEVKLMEKRIEKLNSKINVYNKEGENG